MKLDDKPTDPAALREIANSDEMQEEAYALAKDVQRDAKRLAPVRTGRLRRGIVIEEVTDLRTGIEGFAIGWSDKAFYGWLEENGTEDTPARPHLVPAAIRNGVTSPGGPE